MTHSEPRLQALSTIDTRWLVEEAQRVLADLGTTSTVVDGVALELPDGRLVGLENLARTLPMHPRNRWSRCVRDQLKTLMNATAEAAAEPEQLRVRLWPLEGLRDFLTYRPLEPLPGIAAVLTEQGRDSNRMFGNLDFVGDRDDAYDNALRNLAELPKPRHARRRLDAHERASWVDFLSADDAHSAARLLVLPDLLRRLRIDFPEHGVLVAIPTKHDLWIHVPVDDSVLSTSISLACESHAAFTQLPYPISPDVFLITPDMHAETLIRVGDEGLDLREEALDHLLDALYASEARRAAG